MGKVTTVNGRPSHIREMWRTVDLLVDKYEVGANVYVRTKKYTELIGKIHSIPVGCKAINPQGFIIQDYLYIELAGRKKTILPVHGLDVYIKE